VWRNQLNRHIKEWTKWRESFIALLLVLANQIAGILNVEFGFRPDEKRTFREIAKQIVTKVERDIMWLEPRLFCKVQYLEKTSTGSLRIVSFKGFDFESTP